MIVLLILGGMASAVSAYLIASIFTPSVLAWSFKFRSVQSLVHPLDLLPMEEVKPVEYRKHLKARKALEARYDSVAGELTSSSSRKAITASKQEPVPTPLGMSLPESDLEHLSAFANHVEATRREAEKSGDAEWLREVLTLRNRLAENVQAFQEASSAGVPDEEAVEAFLSNVSHMERHLQGLLQMRVKDAKKKLRTLTSYYENRAEPETSTPA